MGEWTFCKTMGFAVRSSSDIYSLDWLVGLKGDKRAQNSEKHDKNNDFLERIACLLRAKVRFALKKMNKSLTSLFYRATVSKSLFNTERGERFTLCLFF